MVFGNESKTEILKVITLDTVREVAYVVGVPPQMVSNFYHRLMRPRGSLRYVAIFKDA